MCGRSGSGDCIVEGNSCQRFSVAVHQVQFTARDLAGNTDTCDVTVTVTHRKF